MITRNLTLDVCDYNNNILCNLYNNMYDTSGQATDVFVTYERNGAKELSFKLPSTCVTAEGEERNYRLDYLISDYRIRFIDDSETDWYLISEAKITHDVFSTDVEVRAGHISQLLRTKAYDLEFSDEEGNNVGTAEQLLSTILEKTDWTVGEVAEFLELDGSVKVRSLQDPAKTGAFKLISDMCDLFEAKPVYHGNEKTVDILPMNPFSRTPEGDIPREIAEGQNVIELHYDKNIYNFSRTTNTENIVTKLFAYGAYGDTTTGYCSLETSEHKEYQIKTSVTKTAGTEFKFEADGATYYFTTTTVFYPEDVAIWSKLDFASQKYVWFQSKTSSTYNRPYRVYKEPTKEEWPEVTVTETSVRNYFPFIMNFDYYDKVGLLSQDNFVAIAKFQREVSALYKQSIDAAQAFNDRKSELSEIAESNSGFLKLDVEEIYEIDDSDPSYQGMLRLVINKSGTYEDGVIYRSDYMESRKNYFSWYPAAELQFNGLPTYGIGSVLFILHNTNPITFEKVYVKTIWDDNGEPYINSDGTVGPYHYREHSGSPAKLTLWSPHGVITRKPGDRYYLFCTDSMSGSLGERTAEIETKVRVTEGANDGTVEHIMTFVSESEPNPSSELASVNYGWFYRYHTSDVNPGELYICWGEKGEQDWHRVYVSETIPPVENGAYFLGRKNGKFYHGEDNEWVELESIDENYCARNTSAVYRKAMNRDISYNGLYEQYRYRPNNVLSPGNYAFKNNFDFYYIFTTQHEVARYEYLTLDTVKGQVWPDNDVDHIVTCAVKPYDAITFPNENEISEDKFISGMINSKGVYNPDEDKFVSNYIPAYENVQYQYREPSAYFFFYTARKKLISFTRTQRMQTYIDQLTATEEYQNATDEEKEIMLQEQTEYAFNRNASQIESGNFVTPPDTKYIRIYCTKLPTSDHYLRVSNYNNMLFCNNKMYTILTNSGNGKLLGINSLMKDFADIADNAYGPLLQTLTTSQNAIITRSNDLATSLGDLLRESMWQDDQYVEGDELRLYTDAMDNLEEIGQPEYTYDFTFLDLYGSDKDAGRFIEEGEPDWPDIQITDAAHLADPEIEVNKWAYIDILKKCYDQPWKTKLEINTRLSLIGQHSFTDLLTRVAEVSNTVKGKQAIYDRAKYLSPSGNITVEKLEGSLDAAKNTIVGGASSWYTDDKGRIIFDAADGLSSMMLSGAGLMVANTRDEFGNWNWRTAVTGAGVASDEVVTAFLSAKEALIGAITTDMISATVGNDLEIGSNKSLQLYATANGERPAGALTTDDSLIEIAAGNGTDKAHVDILSGGEINIKAGAKDPQTQEVVPGGAINIESYGQLNLKSGADMKIQSGANMYIYSGGKLDIQSGSTFTVNSTNFKVNDDGSVEMTGTVTATAGKIAGFTIGKREIATNKYVDYLYSGGSDNINSTANGVYLGTDGINIGNKLVFSTDGTVAKLKVNADSIDLGSTNGSLQDVINISATVWRCGSSAIRYKSYKEGDIWINTDNDLFNQYLCVSTSFVYTYVNGVLTSEDWVLTSTALTSGAKLKIDAINGTMDMLAANTITVSAASEIRVGAGKSLTLAVGNYEVGNTTYSGTVKIGHAGNLFTIGSNETDAYIYNGKKSMTDKYYSGIYLGTDGIALGRATKTSSDAAFSVLPDGSLYAEKADIAGKITASEGSIGGWKIDSSSIYKKTEYNDGTFRRHVGMSSTTYDSDMAFFAGGRKDTPEGLVTYPFYVTNAGKVYTSNLEVTGGSITIKNGDKTTFSVTSAGYLTSVSGNIAGWTISDTTLKNNKVGLAKRSSDANVTEDNDVAIWAGHSTASSGKFRVYQSGRVVASNMEINGGSISIKNSSGYTKFSVSSQGELSATSGSIAGWTIDSYSMKWIETITSGSTTYKYAKVGISNNVSGTAPAIWAGGDVDRNGSGNPYQSNTSGSNAKFRVLANGKMYATGAEITGSTFTIKDSQNNTLFDIQSNGRMYIRPGGPGTGGWYIDANDFAGPWYGNTTSVSMIDDGFVQINCNPGYGTRIAVGSEGGHAAFWVTSDGIVHCKGVSYW